MKTYEIILNIPVEQREEDPFTIWDGLAVVGGFICLILTVIFLYLIFYPLG